jgi:hypothetical protein
MCHFGSHKCREPVITALIDCFLTSEFDGELPIKPTNPPMELRADAGNISRYTVAVGVMTAGNFAETEAGAFKRCGDKREVRCHLIEQALRKSVEP